MRSRREKQAQAAVASVERWYHRIEVAPGLITPGEHDSPYVLEHLPFPQDCTGMRVLDIGTRDGFFAFEAERRGAREVVAMDIFPADQSGFSTAAELLESRVNFVSANVYDLDEDRFGRFDLVLFLGVLYHLRNPLLALDRIRHVCDGQLVFETEVYVDDSGVPMARYHPGRSLRDDGSNYWTPNVECLRALLETARFDVPQVEMISPDRAAGLALPADDREALYFQRLDYVSDVRLVRVGPPRPS